MRPPSAAINSVRGACKWVSLPGEICRTAVSISVKPCSSNQARVARVMAFLAAKNGLISVYRPADHHGEALLSATINQPPQNASFQAQNQYVAARNRFNWPWNVPVRQGLGAQYQEKQP
jgi:hypothetical protein